MPVGTASRIGRRDVTFASDATNNARAASGTATVGSREMTAADRRVVGEEGDQ